MKVDIFKTVVSIALSSILAYGCFAITDHQQLVWTLTLTAGLVFAFSSIFIFGVSVGSNSRKAMMIRTLAGVFFVLFVIVNYAFAFFDFNKAFYIIINGLLALIFALTLYSMSRARTS